MAKVVKKTAPEKKPAGKAPRNSKAVARTTPGTLSAADAAALRRAVAYLDSDGLIVRLSALLGETAETLLTKIPARLAGLMTDGYSGIVKNVTDKALQGALWIAARTMSDTAQKPSWDKSHKIGAAVTGAVGGFFGLAGAAVEVPITTVIMFRSILDIARGEGADIRDMQTRIECLNVLALAGAVINAAFMDFFQDVARGHFIVLRLEKKYGADIVRAAFDLLRQA